MSPHQQFVERGRQEAVHPAGHRSRRCAWRRAPPGSVQQRHNAVRLFYSRFCVEWPIPSRTSQSLSAAAVREFQQRDRGPKPIKMAGRTNL
jgi:hypothetical protein